MDSIRFMDLCSGIGGGRLGLERNGFKCVAHAEIDPIPEKTYSLFFGDEKNYGDLMKINPDDLPDFDFLIGGFPCQTFSIVGKREGFNDERGNVIYGIEKILKEKNVKYFILENVKGLLSHDKGNSINRITTLLQNAGYDVYKKVISSTACGIPQIRERIYFCGIKKGLRKKDFRFPSPIMTKELKNFLIDDDAEYYDINNATFQKYIKNKYNDGKINLEHILSNDYWIIDTRQSDLRVYKYACPTIRKGRQGLLYVKENRLRVLSGMETLLLQGFPLDLAIAAKKNINENNIKGQAGNAMTVDVIAMLAKQIIDVI